MYFTPRTSDQRISDFVGLKTFPDFVDFIKNYISARLGSMLGIFGQNVQTMGLFLFKFRM